VLLQIILQENLSKAVLIPMNHAEKQWLVFFWNNGILYSFCPFTSIILPSIQQFIMLVFLPLQILLTVD
jgi:hypothetical protein